MHEHGRERGPVGLVDRAEELRAGPRDRADRVRDDDAARREPRAREREELLRDEVGGDRVGEEGVDHDHVPALLVAGEESSPVADVDLQPRVARQPEVLVRHVDDDRIELDRLQLQLREVAPHPLLRGARTEADEEHVARRRVVGDPEVEEVGVAVARPERVVQVHRALERVVEAEVAAVGVVDDREPVVARVLGEDDLQILRLDDGRGSRASR